MNALVTVEQVIDFFIHRMIEINPQYLDPSYFDYGFYKTTCTALYLAYYAYVWYLGLRGERLFEAKITLNFFEFNINGALERLIENGMTEENPPINFTLNNNKFPNQIDDFLNNIWDCYGCYIWATDLNYMHQREAQWIRNKHGLWWDENKEYFKMTIDDSLIKSFYSYDNKEISGYLPENVELGLNKNGLYIIYRVNKAGSKNVHNIQNLLKD